MTDCTAIATLRVRIRARASDPRLALVPGLADDLRLIGEAFLVLQHAVQLLGRAELARQGSYPLTKADYHAIVAMSGQEQT